LMATAAHTNTQWRAAACRHVHHDKREEQSGSVRPDAGYVQCPVPSATCASLPMTAAAKRTWPRACLRRPHDGCGG
jgi:hypothetical protein